MSVTTPEIIQPNQLLAYDTRDFSELVVGGGPDGVSNCLRLNHAADSNRQSLFQPLRVDSHLWPATPAVNALSFWIRRRQAFFGSGTGLPNSLGTPSQTSNAVLGTAGGLIMGVGSAVASSGSVTTIPLSWGLMGYNTDDLGFYVDYRASGSNGWWGIKLADLDLDAWTFIVVNIGVFNAGAGSWSPVAGPWTTYRDAQLLASPTPPASSFGGGSFIRPQNIGPDVARFAIGDPTAANVAVRGVGNGPLVELSQVAFHTKNLTNFEILNLYESMLYA